jgi:hypothetical protein
VRELGVEERDAVCEGPAEERVGTRMRDDGVECLSSISLMVYT